jgi:hypothetical protein
VSIKRLPPESIETFSMVLHPKRRYSARASYLMANSGGGDTIPFGALATEASDPIVTEDSDFITTES